jgi:aryl-alcohol dehydrogenase-like predicted oxidoreductase
LTSETSNRDGKDQADFRTHNPRFAGEAGEKNLTLVQNLESIATEKGVTVAQLALAWVLSRGGDVVPIPGTKRRKWLRENIAADEISLSDADVAALETAVPREAVAGDRYPERSMGSLNG